MHNPYPKELQKKFTRVGWGEWVPTPGVSDEGVEIYLTDNKVHVHAMSTAEALALSDEEFNRRLWDALEGHREEAIERYRMHTLIYKVR